MAQPLHKCFFIDHGLLSEHELLVRPCFSWQLFQILDMLDHECIIIIIIIIIIINITIIVSA